MIVHFSSGPVLFSTDLKDWASADLLAFAKVVENLGAATDLRFCAVIDGEATFVFVRVAAINLLQFSQEEYDLMTTMLNPPVVAEKTGG